MKILVLCLPGIGDSLMATPMIHVLRKEFPKARIDVLCMFKGVEYIFKNNKDINNVYFVSIFSDKRFLAIYHLLPFRFKRYDLSILAFPAYRKEYHIVQWIIHAKKRLAHRFKKGYSTEWNFLDTSLIDVDEKVHNVINNLNLLHALNIKWEKKYAKQSFSYSLNLDIKDESYGKKYIKDLGWENKFVIGFHPGSIDSRAGILKRWPIERFILLAKKTIKNNSKILVFCGPFEISLGEKLVKGVNDPKNCRLVTGTSFGESLGILNQANVFVSNDNGFAHLSNPLKVKSIVLFGPTNPLWCSPFNKRFSRSIRKAKFEPWFRNDTKVANPPKGVKSGMSQINVDDVFNIIKDVKKNV